MRSASRGVRILPAQTTGTSSFADRSCARTTAARWICVESGNHQAGLMRWPEYPDSGSGGMFSAGGSESSNRLPPDTLM